MTPVSIIKIAASVSVLVAVCGAALVFSVKHAQGPETGVVSAVTSAPPPAPVSERKDGPSALEATEAKVAALAPDVAAPKGAVATDQALPAPPRVPATDQSAPSFDLARVEGGGDAVIAGRAAPGAVVDLLRGGERIDRAVADASGQFVMVPPRLPPGSYELTLSAKLPDGTLASSKQGVTVTVAGVAASAGAGQSRAEYVPGSAPQARPPSQAASTPKPQESAALKPAQANAGDSAAPEHVSSTAVAPRALTKVVSRGDSLWRISRITYGDGTRYAVVYRANRDQIRDPNLIHPGQTLILPAKPQ
jgi:nucleoid-associated protein YgaU